VLFQLRKNVCMEQERLVPIAGVDAELLAQHRARYVFASQFVPGKSVLDVACGAGYGAEILLEGKPSRIAGVDVSPAAVEFARSRYSADNVEFLVGDAEHMPDIGKFDVVTSFETIEHLSRPELFLEGIGKRLSTGGRLIISTPIRRGGTLRTTPGNPFHVREWNEEEFDSLLSCHFGIRSRYFQFIVQKRAYPGSRTISKLLSRALTPAKCAAFMKFPVTREVPASLPGVLTKGYIIVVCTI